MHSNIPINLLDHVVEILWKEGHYEYNKSDEKGNSLLNKILENDNSETCIFYTIYDMDNKPIGFILCEFKEIIDQNELKERRKYIKYLGEKVSPILEFSEYYKNNIK